MTLDDLERPLCTLLHYTPVFRSPHKTYALGLQWRQLLKISIFTRDRFADQRDVWFYGAGGFRLSVHLYHRGLHTRTAVARNPCVDRLSWAFLFVVNWSHEFAAGSAWKTMANISIPWVYYGEPIGLANSCGQVTMKNSWISFLEFSWVFLWGKYSLYTEICQLN